MNIYIQSFHFLPNTAQMTLEFCGMAVSIATQPYNKKHEFSSFVEEAFQTPGLPSCIV